MSYQKSLYEVGDIIGENKEQLFQNRHFDPQQKKVLTSLANCRTMALGYHRDQCDNNACKHEHYSYNSCRDRHCPKCNGLKRWKWVLDRTENLLPVKYFHTVFTVPHEVNYLFKSHPVEMNNLLFHCAWQTIDEFCSRS
ncbi:MAG TPA: transposase zinc-binding domain-containing protein [Draconibacterium sp.]|nr:transposase zinc-binding domain-containing protein [Draconibacterium sp.]